MKQRRPAMLPEDYERERAALVARIEGLTARAIKAERELALAEERGRRWLTDAIRYEETLRALIVHVDAEADAGRAGQHLYIYRHLRGAIFRALEEAAR